MTLTCPSVTTWLLDLWCTGNDSIEWFNLVKSSGEDFDERAEQKAFEPIALLMDVPVDNQHYRDSWCGVSFILFDGYEIDEVKHARLCAEWFGDS